MLAQSDFPALYLSAVTITSMAVPGAYDLLPPNNCNARPGTLCTSANLANARWQGATLDYGEFEDAVFGGAITAGCIGCPQSGQDGKVEPHRGPLCAVQARWNDKEVRRQYRHQYQRYQAALRTGTSG